MAPGESYPLPTAPAEVSKITLRAYTAPVITFSMALFSGDFQLTATPITSNYATITWDLRSTYSVGSLTMINTEYL